jgi:hypothetical protein
MKNFVIACTLIFTCLISFRGEALYIDGSIRGGFYFPTTNRATCAVTFWSPFVQLESNFHFADPWTLMPWTGWTNIGLIVPFGSFCGQHSATLLPIGGGIKYSWCLGGLREAYVGFGMTYSWFNSKGDNRSHRHGFGGVIKLGVRQYYWNCYFGELFLDYNYFKLHDFDASGVYVGGAMGMIF